MRKMFFTIVALAAMATSAFAQTEAGNIYVGAASDLGFTTTKAGYDGAKSEAEFGLDVNGGYFVIDNLSVNAELGFNYWSQDKDATNTFSLGVGGRYYLPMKVFFGAMFDFSSMGVSHDGKSGDDRLSSMGLTLGAGYAWFLNDNVAIEPALGYRIGLSSKTEPTQYNWSGFEIKIGFGIYF